MKVPVIDFAICGLNVADELVTEERINDVGEKLYHALQNFGFAYLKNTGIPAKETADVDLALDQFYRAPLEKKKKYPIKDFYGYVALNEENVDPSNPQDYKEAFIIPTNCFQQPDVQWPHDISEHFRSSIKEFTDKCFCLTNRIFKALAVGMNLQDTDYFTKCHSSINKERGNKTAFRSNYYPPLPKEAPLDSLRLGKHTDYGCISLLFQDNVGGLQVEDMNGEFVDAAPIEDTVVINIGDLLQSWSRGKLKSTMHRVVNVRDPEKQKLVRKSMGYFVFPDDDVLVDEELLFKGDTPVKQVETASRSKMTALEYLNMKFSKISDY